MMTLLLERTDTDVILRIPKEYWNKTDMVDSSEIKIDFANYGIEVVDISVPTYDIDKMMEGITPGMYHPDLFLVGEEQEQEELI